MIGIKLQGRLGNQLFQYAFAFATSKQLNTSFYIDQANQEFIIPLYFNVPTNFSLFLERYLFSIRGYHNLFSYRFKRTWYKLLSKVFLSGTMTFEPDKSFEEISIVIKNNILFQGYFQSEKYFKSYSDSVRQLFSIKSQFVNDYHQKYSNLFSDKKIITVHIRKDDYLNLGHLQLGGSDLSLPFSYYHKIIGKLNTADSLFVLITDDQEKIKSEFNYLDNVYFSEDHFINDLQHLINADICIIANSTFSWWGAWLNTKPDHKVFAPEYFMGHLVKKMWPPDIYPAHWNLVNAG
jgi:hypothetical protein